MHGLMIVKRYWKSLAGQDNLYQGSSALSLDLSDRLASCYKLGFEIYSMIWHAISYNSQNKQSFKHRSIKEQGYQLGMQGLGQASELLWLKHA